jgi:hypothetical protein
MRAEHRLRAFENGLLRKIFGSKRDEVTGEKRRLHNEELYNMYSSSSSGITGLSGHYPFPKFSVRFLFVEAFQQNIFFMGWGCKPHAQPPICRTRLSLFVWVITFDLSDARGLTSSCATASIALRNP